MTPTRRGPPRTCDHGPVRAVGLLVVMLLAASCSGVTRYPEDPRPTVVFRTDGGRVFTGPLRVADTDATRERGLMGVTNLPPDEGMVFLFDGPSTTSFGMKDTVIPLSIAFWDGSGRVVDILEMEPCHQDSCTEYAARSPYVTALEMNRDWFASHGIQIGDHADIRVPV